MKKMKKILVLLVLFFVLFFVSCTKDKDYEQSNFCRNSTITILNKVRFRATRGIGYSSHRLYLYNGVEALWYETDEKTYSCYEINDTLPTLVIMTINTFKK